MPVYGKSLCILVGFGELRYTEVKIVHASTDVCSSPCPASGWAVAQAAVSSQRMMQDQVMLISAGLQTKRHVCAQVLDQRAQW